MLGMFGSLFGHTYFLGQLLIVEEKCTTPTHLPFAPFLAIDTVAMCLTCVLGCGPCPFDLES